MADEQIPGYNKAAVTRRGVDEFLGLCKGVIADGSVCEPEAKFLLNWLEGNALVQTEFPVSHIYPRLAEMLSGGTLSEADAQALLVLLQSATGEQGQQAAVNMSTGSAFDDPQPRLNIAGEVYCLTGDFAFGSRKAVKNYIETLGGTVSDKTVLASGCILVVGCKGSDAWLHSTHGSKIKDAVDKRAKGYPVCIVSEEHFINQALDAERRMKEGQEMAAVRQDNTRQAVREIMRGNVPERRRGRGAPKVEHPVLPEVTEDWLKSVEIVWATEDTQEIAFRCCYGENNMLLKMAARDKEGQLFLVGLVKQANQIYAFPFDAVMSKVSVGERDYQKRTFVRDFLMLSFS